MSKLPWTHFHINSAGRITGYALDTCETCGGPIAAPNAVELHEPPARLRALGLTELPSAPAESWHDDDAGAEVCEFCCRTMKNSDRVKSTRVPFTFEELLILRDAITILLVSQGYDSREEAETLRNVKRRLTEAVNNIQVT